MSVLSRIQSALREDRYEITGHALEEADDEEFWDADIRHAILEGRLVKRYTRDPRGTRYELLGLRATDE